MPEIDNILRLVADMETLSPAGDKLSKLIGRLEEDELMEEDLNLVAAAASRPSYTRFLELAEKRGIKKPTTGHRN